eukprot:Selendium_serpulae@DN7204_c0_g1_i1.p1
MSFASSAGPHVKIEEEPETLQTHAEESDGDEADEDQLKKKKKKNCCRRMCCCGSSSSSSSKDNDDIDGSSSDDDLDSSDGERGSVLSPLSYRSRVDVALIGVGLLLFAAAGTLMPLFILVFGELINTIGGTGSLED